MVRVEAVRRPTARLSGRGVARVAARGSPLVARCLDRLLAEPFEAATSQRRGVAAASAAILREHQNRGRSGLQHPEAGPDRPMLAGSDTRALGASRLA